MWMDVRVEGLRLCWLCSVGKSCGDVMVMRAEKRTS